MDTCDVLIAGGGPAGAACAWKLGQAGFDVLVADRAAFPRDKPCAGWITPQILADIDLDLDDYRRGRTLQPIAGFRVGVIGRDVDVGVSYDRPVSYAIRRCEFDDYLLRRSHARLALGTPVATVERDGDSWIVNRRIRTPMVVGAGGHFCPIGRLLNPSAQSTPHVPHVVAQEAELAIAPELHVGAAPGIPELFFSADFAGYGWCCRKERYVNVGYGELFRHRSLPALTAEFVGYLERRGRVPPGMPWPWRGHAYVVRDRARRRVAAPGVLLIGDAAGVADPRSGEGIRPAIESGLLAAETIVAAGGRYTDSSAARYDEQLRARFAPENPDAIGRILPAALVHPLARALLRIPRFVRSVVLDEWFLHRSEPPLAAKPPSAEQRQRAET